MCDKERERVLIEIGCVCVCFFFLSFLFFWFIFFFFFDCSLKGGGAVVCLFESVKFPTFSLGILRFRQFFFGCLLFSSFCRRGLIVRFLSR